jgi:hypothetical protein
MTTDTIDQLIYTCVIPSPVRTVPFICSRLGANKMSIPPLSRFEEHCQAILEHC